MRDKEAFFHHRTEKHDGPPPPIDRAEALSRLTRRQRAERRLALQGAGYDHADGMIELDFQPRAGIDPWKDDQATQDLKLDRWMRRNAIVEAKRAYFFYGVFLAILVPWLWERSFFLPTIIPWLEAHFFT